MQGAYCNERLENVCYYFSQQFKHITGKKIIKPILSIFLLLFEVSGLTINLQPSLELNFKTHRDVLSNFPVEILDDIDFKQFIEDAENKTVDFDYFSQYELERIKEIKNHSLDLMADFEILYEIDLKEFE